MNRILPLASLLVALCVLPATAILDSENGMSDVWELQFNNGNLFPPNSPDFTAGADPDGDGWTNEQEATAGTDPFDATAPNGFVRPDVVILHDVMLDLNHDEIPEFYPEVAAVSWPVILGKQYTLLASPDLTTWIQVEQSPNIADATWTYNFAITNDEPLFWRVRIEDVDSDGDGLTDAEEYALGTGPHLVDTDGDGSTDWAEVMISIQGGLPEALVANPLNADANNDGIPDGQQLDYDKDGTPDDRDVAPHNELVSYAISMVPKFALFPIGNAQPAAGETAPWQISDKGTVLYSNGTWTAGQWTPLSAATDDLSLCQAKSINNNDVILGGGVIAARQDPVRGQQLRVCYWTAPDAQPATFTFNFTTGEIFPSPSYDFAYGNLRYGEVLSDNGSFLQNAHRTEGLNYPYVGPGEWKLPAANAPATLAVSIDGLRFLRDGGLKWGLKVPLDANGNPDWNLPIKGQMAANNNPAHEVPFPPKTLAVQPNGDLIATPMSPEKMALVWRKFAWHEDALCAQAIDFSTDGTAIGKDHDGKTAPILINGKWKGIEAHTPGVPQEWKTGTSLLDTTPGGWVLAKRQPATGNAEYGVLLPIRLNGVDPGYTPPTVPAGQPVPDPPDYFSGGVDHLTARAEGGAGHVPEVWIMAPIGGSTSVRWKSPLNATSKLKPECDKAAFSPQEITASTLTTVQVSGNALQANEDPTQTDFPTTLKLGTAQQASSSIPVKVKRMKKRTVGVALHYLYSVDKNGQTALPFYQPDPGDLKIYLDKIFGPQVNVTFNIPPAIPEGSASAGIDFDKDNDGKLESNIDDERVAATPKARAGTTGSNINIDVWVFGGDVGLTAPYGIIDEAGYGVAFDKSSQILINGNQAALESIPANYRMEHIYFTIAHEIGHVMTGGIPHPGESGYPLSLQWPTRTEYYLTKRLMCPGAKANHSFPGTCLIKKEWDLIEAWLKHEEDEGRL